MDAGRKLAMDEVTKLLNQPKTQREQSKIATTAVDDFYGQHANELLDMLDGKRDNVIINGHTMIVAKREDDRMYIKPTEGFVPCGWFSREWLRGKLAKTR